MLAGRPVSVSELPLKVDWGAMLDPEMLGTPGEGLTMSGTGTGTGTGTGAGNDDGHDAVVFLPPPPPAPGAAVAPLPVPLPTFRDAYRRGKQLLPTQQPQQREQQQSLLPLPPPPMTMAAARWDASDKFPRLAADLLGSLPFGAVTHPRGALNVASYHVTAGGPSILTTCSI